MKLILLIFMQYKKFFVNTNNQFNLNINLEKEIIIDTIKNLKFKRTQKR